MQLFELPIETKASSGWTHKAILTHSDLTTTTANTAQTIDLLTLEAGDVVKNVAYKLVTAFEDASDTAFNVTTLAVGEDGDVDEFVDETEVNKNGTEVLYSAGFAYTDAACTLPKAYTAASKVNATFMSMAAKSLSDIDAGEAHVYLSVVKLSDL